MTPSRPLECKIRVGSWELAYCFDLEISERGTNIVRNSIRGGSHSAAIYLIRLAVDTRRLNAIDCELQAMSKVTSRKEIVTVLLGIL